MNPRLAGLLSCSAVVLASGLAAAAPAAADASSVYAAGSHVRLLAHVAGLNAAMADVPVAGLTQAQAASAVVAAEKAAAKKTLSLVAAPVHGKVTTTKIAAGSVLAAAPKVALADPATLPASAYSPAVTLVLAPKSVAALAAKVAKVTTVTPVNASVATNAKHPVLLLKGYNGSQLDASRLPTALIKALGSGATVLPEKPLMAQYPASTLNKVIVVHTVSNRLDLYAKGKLVHVYTVSTGQAGYPSPHGLFHVIEREGAPSWYNPHDPWSVSLPDVIGPGPDNPLGTRALQLDSPGILIHGIPLAENAALGSNASHGCVRVERSQMEALYPQVPLGTPVLMTA